MKKRSKGMKQAVLDVLDLPADAAGNTLRITQSGREHVLIENHLGIYEYLPCSVRLNTAQGILRVQGESLTLRELTSERAYISGHIYSIGLEVKQPV